MFGAAQLFTAGCGEFLLALLAIGGITVESVSGNEEFCLTPSDNFAFIS
jgi:hypothetical protein